MHLPGTDAQTAFWRAHDRSGVLVSAGGGGLAVAYALLTWDLSGRGWMLAIGAVVLLLVPPLLLALPAWVPRRWRGALYYVLEVVGIGVVTTLVWLDGGLGSPLTLLYLLLLVHGIAVYPTWVSVVMTGLVLCAFLGLGVALGADPARSGVAAGAILLTAAVAAVAAHSHISLQQHHARVQALLREQARTDGLTGVLNRQGIGEALALRLAGTSAGTSTSVLSIDLDGFKALNDADGHLVGDGVLQQVAAALGRASRAGDLVGRPGGDEFLLVLPGADGEAAAQVAARIHGELHRDRVPITVSIGLATAAPGETGQDLLERADQALYAAKRAGRGCTRGAPSVV